MKTKVFLNLLIITLLLPLFAGAQGDMISVKELAKLVKDKNTVIVSARKAKDYKQVHIKNAVNIWHKDLYKDGPIEAILKSPEELAKIFAAKGISNTNTIVLYDSGTGKYSGRIYWTLKYLGCENVKILNGHMDAWRKGRKPVTKNPTKRKPASFVPKVNKSVLASMADVKAAKGVVLDVRSEKEFKGIESESVRKGHIPGSINLEFNKIIKADKMLKSKEEMAAIFKKAGLSPEKEVILYCESSVRTGIVYLVLTTILNYKNVKVYDGAYHEWEANAANKVVK